MQENTINAKPIQIADILKNSLSFYKKNFSLLFTISLLGYSISILEQLFRFFGISLSWFGMIVTVAGTILSFWAYVALIFAVSEEFQGRSIGIKESFISIKDKTGRFIGVSILWFLLWALGTLLLVIPGMYWMVIFSLAGLVVVLEDAAFFESFKRSKILVQGSFWPILFLGLIQFIIPTPTWFVYQIDMTMAIKTILVTIFSAVYIPWVVIIDVDIYNRLKKAKSDLKKTEEETKKVGGCLGCLAMVGLFVAIMVVGSIWFKNLGGFVKTEKGSKAYEWIAKQVSPKVMKFGDTITLKRPSGYLVMGGQYEDTTYVLYGFPNRQFNSVSIFAIPYDKLGIVDPSVVTLGSGEVWDKYYAYLNEQSSYNEMKFKNMEKDLLSVVNFNGRQWSEYVLKEKEQSGAKSQKVWVYHYTLADNNVIFVTHGYGEKDGEVPVSKSDEIERIIRGFNF